MACMQSFTCKVNGCQNQSQYPERIQLMPHVNTLQWHKAPENADVRQLWGLLIKGIARHSFVCSNHFVNGQPSVENPHPTLYLDGNSIRTSSSTNEIIQRWRKDYDDEQLKTGRLPAIRNRLTKNVDSPNSSTKNAKVTKSAEPLNTTSSHSNKAEFIKSLETQNSGTHATKARLTNKIEFLISSLSTKGMIFAKGEKQQNSVSHTQKGKRAESAESPNSSTPAKMARLTKSPKFQKLSSAKSARVAKHIEAQNFFHSYAKKAKLKKSAVSQNSSSPAKRSRLSKSIDSQNSFSLGTEVSFKEDRSESVSSKSDGAVVSSGGSDSKNSESRSTKVDNSKGIQMSRDGNAPSGMKAKTKNVTSEMQMYNELAKPRLMLKKTVQNDNAVIDDQEVNFSDISSCLELNKNTLKSDFYPRLQLTRLPLPKDFDFSLGCVNLSSLPASVCNYTRLIEEETPSFKPFHPDNNTVETADIFQKEFAKLESVKPHAVKTKDLSGDSFGGNEDFASLSTEKQSSSVTQNEVMSGVPVHNNIYEPPCSLQEADEKKSCDNCKFHLHHINLITGQMDSLKKQVRMLIESNKEHVNTNYRLNQKLLVANDHVVKLEMENKKLKNAISQIRNNVKHGFPSQQLNQAGGRLNLVKTKDGQTFLLKKPVHGGNAEIHPTQPSPDVNSIALSQMNSISSQSCVPRSVVPQSHVRQPPPSVLQPPNQSQALTKPAQMFLRLGPGSCLIGQLNKDVPCSTGVVSQPDNLVSPAVSVESNDTAVVPQTFSVIPNGTGVLPHLQDSQMQPVNDQNTSVGASKYVSVISQLQASMNKFTNSQSSVTGSGANTSSQQPVCNIANQPSSLMPIQPHLAPKAAQLTPVEPCLPPTLPRLAPVPPQLAPVPPRLALIPPCLAPIPLHMPSIPQHVAPILQHVGNTGSQHVNSKSQHVGNPGSQPARRPFIIPSPAQTHPSNTLPTSKTIRTSVSQQPNHNSNSKCVICKFLARQVQRQETEIGSLKKQLDVLDKINAKIVGMFIPASSAFLCLIGMEQIKC